MTKQTLDKITQIGQAIDNTKLPDGGDASMWEKFWSFAQLGRVLFANMSRTEAEAAIDKSMKEQK